MSKERMLSYSHLPHPYDDDDGFNPINLLNSISPRSTSASTKLVMDIMDLLMSKLDR
jgi:hypothetical protein